MAINLVEQFEDIVADLDTNSHVIYEDEISRPPMSIPADVVVPFEDGRMRDIAKDKLIQGYMFKVARLERQAKLANAQPYFEQLKGYVLRTYKEDYLENKEVFDWLGDIIKDKVSNEEDLDGEA